MLVFGAVIGARALGRARHAVPLQDVAMVRAWVSREITVLVPVIWVGRHC